MKDEAPPGVAVVGCGRWGRNLVRKIHALGALRAVVDVDPLTSRTLSEQYGVPAVDLDGALGDPTVQGVVVAVPAVNHAEVAAKVLDAGKHALIEKPLALHVGEAEALCGAADRAGRVLMVGHVMQYHSAFVELGRLVRQGALGRLRYAYSNRLNLGRIRRDESTLWSFAPHDVSMILTLMSAEPVSVRAVGGSYVQPGVTDVTTTHLAFPGGERAHVFVSWLHPVKEHKLVVVGEEAMAVFDDGRPWASKLRLFRHGIAWRDGVPEAVRAEGEPVTVEPGEPLEVECRHFLDCMASGSTPRTDGREGVRVMRVLEAAERSLGLEAGVPAEAASVRPRVFVHESAYVDAPCEIGDGTKVWHFSHLLAGTRIGRDCTLGQNVMVGPDVTVGDGCKIQNNVSIYRGVTLEEGVFCGPSCVFTNVAHPRAQVDRGGELRPTIVGRGATIGANATVVCGHRIGAWAMVAAGAVVTSDIPPHALVAGVPARRIGWVSHDGERLGDDLVCPRTGQRYVLVGPDRLERAGNE